ncbi:hypothetical protein KBC59_02120 [Patescibacteria group bacterium]|jgi:tRNA(Phe) wybutosine-synthesizing methylase Tyw3|nr:hypothetical protein [Patescibacteria group bacterium]
MIKGTIQSIQGDQLTVEILDGQVLNVPASSVEGTVVVGGEIFLFLAAPGGEQAARAQFARDLLNQLLTG